MHDQATRTAILRLREEGHGSRAIARALGVSRNAVKHVLRDGKAEPPAVRRTEKAEPYRDAILDLHARCKGNLVRVHEELRAQGATLSYQALTAFCRRQGIGHEPPAPAGQYHFEPGQEMQHDTSPHDAELGGKLRRVQTASVVLCYSRMIFFQHYPRFTRFECKVFLTEALRYFEGACGVCMIDNTHVVVLSGTGRDMVPVPEMVAYAERLNFAFRAHERGDADRSARVERPFSFIENNFLAGRRFADWGEINREARAWCDRINATPKRHLHASPRELFAVERPRLRPLPLWLPEVYALHQRICDLEGYINLHQNRYSVPWRLIGHRLEVRETKDRVDVYHGPRLVAAHQRELDPIGARVTLAEHRPPRSEGLFARGRPPPEEEELLRTVPELGDYLGRLKKRGGRGGVRDCRRLLNLVRDYPRAPLLAAVGTATEYGLFDLDRLERLVLRQIARDFFRLPRGPGSDEDPEPSND
jgi:transposase